MHNFVVILGMGWLAKYWAVMVCFDKTVRLFIDWSGDPIEFVGERRPHCTRLISAVKVEMMMRTGCEDYIALITKDKQTKGVEEIPAVHEFPDVFPDEIPGLPPIREMGFTIELYLEQRWFLEFLIAWLQQSYVSWRPSCRSCWITVLSNQVCLLVVRQCYSWRRSMDRWGCVLTIDNWTKLGLRTSILFRGLTSSSISFKALNTSRR